MKMTHDEMIEVIQAHKAGKTIQYYSNILERWKTTDEPLWEFCNTQYRVKPLTAYVNLYVKFGKYLNLCVHDDLDKALQAISSASTGTFKCTLEDENTIICKRIDN